MLRHQKSYLLARKEYGRPSEEEADFEENFASILGRFAQARERPKLGFRIGGLHFLRISGVGR